MKMNKWCLHNSKISYCVFILCQDVPKSGPGQKGLARVHKLKP